MAAESTPFDWKAFSRKPWVIAVTGLVIPPIGIILTWLKPDWSSKKKWLITGFLTLLLIGRFNAASSVDESEQVAGETVSAEDSSERSNGNTAANATSGDIEDDPEYQEGYRYVSGILAAAKRAPPNMKTQIMQPLRDLAEEAEQGSSKRSRRFFKGASKAMDDLLQDVLNDMR